MDRSLVGDSRNESFFRIVVPPGVHTLTVTNVRNVKLHDMIVTTDSDNIYYVDMQIGASPVSGRPKLVLVSQNEAQPRVRQCSLLKTGTTALDR